MVATRTSVLLILLGVATLLADNGSPPFTMLSAAINNDTLTVAFPYAAYVTPDDSAALVAGQDIVIVCRLELWQKRRLWFDRLRKTDANYFRLSYDRWNQKFMVEYQDRDSWETSRRFARLDSLLFYLEDEIPFSFALAEEDLMRQSYLAYAIEINYLTLEQIDELTDWLRGRAPDAGDSKSLPDKILNLMLRTSGLKNRSDLRASRQFRPGELEGPIKF